MHEFRELTALANDRFSAYLDMLGGAPAHRVQFSRRLTTSWAIIYYRRHLVRLSPYLFLLEPHELKHRTHWQELDATLRHEAAHAVRFARAGETGHSAGFHALLASLGVEPNGGCDLGPENAAFRYVYACPSCSALWHRRLPLRGNWSCGICSPGRYDDAVRMSLLLDMGPPWARLGTLRRAAIEGAIEEARASDVRIAPARRFAPAPVVAPVPALASAPKA